MTSTVEHKRWEVASEFGSLLHRKPSGIFGSWQPCHLRVSKDEQLLSYGNNLNKLGALRIRDITHIEWKDSEAAFTISFDSPKLKLEFRTAPADKAEYDHWRRAFGLPSLSPALASSMASSQHVSDLHDIELEESKTMTTSEWKAARFCALLTQVQKADEEVSDLILSSALMTALEACAFPTSYEAICRTQAGKGASIAMRARAVLLDYKTGKCHPGRSFKKDAAFLALVNAESKFQPNDPFEILRMVDSLRTETFAVKYNSGLFGFEVFDATQSSHRKKQGETILRNKSVLVQTRSEPGSLYSRARFILLKLVDHLVTGSVDFGRLDQTTLQRDLALLGHNLAYYFCNLHINLKRKTAKFGFSAQKNRDSQEEEDD